MRHDHARRMLFPLIISVALLGACDAIKDATQDANLLQDALKAKGIGAFKVEPPVTAVTPPVLFGAASAAPLNPFPQFATDTTHADTVIQVVKDRFFTPGPTFTKSILAGIDGRVSGLNEMALSRPRKCLDDAPASFDVTYPTALNFPMYLSCIQTMTGGAQESNMFVVFGKKDDVFYVHEGMSNGGGTFASVATGGTVEAWIQVGDINSTGTRSLMHLKASQSAGTLEFTVTGQGTGVGCGVQYRSNKDFIYLAGKFSDGMDVTPETELSACDDAAVPTQTVCLNASDLTVADDASCVSAGLNSFELPALNRSFIPYEKVYLVGAQKPDGLRNFDEADTTATPKQP
jgi:hypothetical protein